MNVSVEHTQGEDFGTLILYFGKDDSYEVTPGVISIPLYTSEARDMVESLRYLAEEPEA